MEHRLIVIQGAELLRWSRRVPSRRIRSDSLARRRGGEAAGPAVQIGSPRPVQFGVKTKHQKYASKNQLGNEKWNVVKIG
jgi:hypothetical protein